MIAVWLWPDMNTLTTAAITLCLIGVTISLTLYGLDDRRGERWRWSSMMFLILFFGARVLGAYVQAHR